MYFCLYVSELILRNPLQGDNSKIIATDSQKNTVYVLAKRHGVESPERFALLLASHFLKTYRWVIRANVSVTSHPWKRIVTGCGREHNHAFVTQAETQR